MKKAMLSQPMAGKSNEEIVATREKAIAALKERGYEIVNTLFTDELTGARPRDCVTGKGSLR